MSIEDSFKESGFAEINNELVLDDIKNFYFDIANYLAIVLYDDGRFKDESLQIFNSLEDVDIEAIDTNIQNAMFTVQKTDRALLGKLYEMGTRPNKFLAGNRLFFNDEIKRVTEAFFRSKSEGKHLLVKPEKGETLHLFTPGESQFKYNLPIHQDYQYLGQSADQLTFWLFLSGSRKSGGVRVFPGTHIDGPLECIKDEHGHHEVSIKSASKFDFGNGIDFGGEQFQLLAIDSLTCHQSIRSSCEISSRLTYIWRVSNLNSKNRELFGKSY